MCRPQHRLTKTEQDRHRGMAGWKSQTRCQRRLEGCTAREEMWCGLSPHDEGTDVSIKVSNQTWGSGSIQRRRKSGIQGLQAVITTLDLSVQKTGLRKWTGQVSVKQALVQGRATRKPLMLRIQAQSLVRLTEMREGEHLVTRYLELE